MPKQDRNDARAPADDQSVHLKKILGVRPGTYLTVIYGIALLLLVYFFLFYPGIRNHGAYITVSSFPSHAAVLVDGQYAGSTPCTIFLKHGDRSVQISKPFYTPVTVERKVGGRVFFTLFARDRSSLSVDLNVADLPALLSAALTDYQKNPEIPTLISDAAWASVGPASQDLMWAFVQGALQSTTNEPQMRQLLSAAGRVATRGTFLTPSSFVSLLQHGAALAQRYDNFPAWVLLSVTKDRANTLVTSEWVRAYVASYQQALSRYYQPGSQPPAAAGGGVSVGGIAFRSIPGGELVMGKDDNLASLGSSIDRLLPHPVRVDSFYIGVTEVTNAQFQTFVAENPDWSPSNRDALVAKGLVTDTYLSGWNGAAAPAGMASLPVTSVSWYAAQAYTSWLSRRAQAALPGYVARLPLESEWEWAARGGLRGMPYPLGGKPGGAVFFHNGITGPSPVGTSEPNAYGLRDMLGNVWEWCADPFTLSSYLLSSHDPRTSAEIERGLVDSPDRVVRGCGWENQPGTDRVYTRGYQPKDWCTAYLGFRVALARK